MRKAIIISLIIHGLALILVFRHSGGNQSKYPPVMMVHLSSPPPLLGVQNPPVPKATETAIQPKATKTPEPPPRDARTTDINLKKKPKKPQQPKQAQQAKEEESSKPSTQEQKNKGLPDGVELGSEFGFAKLDASGFDSPYYLNILFSKIRNQWENPYEGSNEIACTIYFVLGRDGQVIDNAVEKSSGFPAYDQSALRAVLSAKAPPLPNQFGSEELGIHLEFQYIPSQ